MRSIEQTVEDYVTAFAGLDYLAGGEHGLQDGIRFGVVTRWGAAVDVLGSSIVGWLGDGDFFWCKIHIYPLLGEEFVSRVKPPLTLSDQIELTSIPLSLLP